MCIEIYSTDQPIQIPYAHEVFRFLAPDSFRGRYMFLIRNAGHRPISLLSVLFPRPILVLKSSTEHDGTKKKTVSFSRVRNITHDLPSRNPFFVTQSGDRLEMRLPDPNNPMCDLPPFNGYWRHDNAAWKLHPGALASEFEWMTRRRFAAWNVELGTPIEAGDAHWFYWEICVDNAGDLLEDSIWGPVVFHEIASPIDVRRTVVENLLCSLKDVRELATTPNDPEEKVVERLLNGLGLLQERRVDIQYYELTIETGDPREQFLAYCLPQGDIRLRSGSPRVGRNAEWDRERFGEPIFEWKSGSILEPAHPWKNTGFTIRMGLGCTKKFVQQRRDRQQDPRP